MLVTCYAPLVVKILNDLDKVSIADTAAAVTLQETVAMVKKETEGTGEFNKYLGSETVSKIMAEVDSVLSSMVSAYLKSDLEKCKASVCEALALSKEGEVGALLEKASEGIAWTLEGIA